MYGTPPVAVAKVSQAVLFLLLNHRLDMKTAWSEFKDLLENPTDFMQQLILFSTMEEIQ